MTPFEMAVLAMFILLSLTNMQGFAHHPNLDDQPRWYVFTILAVLVAVVVSLVNVAFNGVFQ